MTDTTAMLADIRFRVDDTREQLMATNMVSGERVYGCDEWSTPVVNLAKAVEKIDAAIAALAGQADAVDKVLRMLVIAGHLPAPVAKQALDIWNGVADTPMQMAEGWVLCSVRMPEPHSAYLVYGLGWDYPEVDWYGPMNDEDDPPEFAVHGAQVTHWQAMPPFPAADRADELTALIAGATP